MNTPDIFLSYNRDDQATAKRFAEAFEAEGFSVWWDVTLRSGEAYDKVTENALKTAKAVVVLWSKKSVDSRWVRAEATIADRNRTLLPVRIEPCDLPVMFELTQTADLSHWSGEPDDKTWLTFIDDVRLMIGHRAPKSIETVPDRIPETQAGKIENGVPFVALLPLNYRAGDDEMEVLAEDLTEEITTELARNRYFKIIAARTMVSWRDNAIDYQELGHKLKVDYLIEGKVQRIGDALRLTMQLIDTETVSVVCSLRFVHEVANIEAVPEQFPALVACQLQEHIVQTEIKRAMSKQGPLSAWEHLLRAQEYRTRMESETSCRQRIEEERSAIEAAPDFGLAHALLANDLANQSRIGGKALSDTEIREIQSHIKRAIQVDGNNPDVLSNLSATYLHLGDAEAGLRLAQRAAHLDPYSIQAKFALGLTYFSLGRLTDTIDLFSKLDRLVSLDSTSYGTGTLALLGICLFMENRSAEAEAAIDRSLAFAPDFYVTLRWKAVIAAELGKDRAAKVAIMQLRKIEPGRSIDQYLRSLRHLPFEHKRKDEAIAILRRLLEETGGET